MLGISADEWHSFNPRLPGGRRRLDYADRQGLARFNPRLPGGRRPRPSPRHAAVLQSFNPRLPGGRRPIAAAARIASVPFQSTPSGGKATNRGRTYFGLISVSIHAFRGEGDVEVFAYLCASLPSVSIHAFRGEGDRRGVQRDGAGDVSIHAFRGEGDHTDRRRLDRVRCFNPRLPGGRRL